MNVNRLGRILVVDDDDWILSGVTAVLNEAGFEVQCARDGQEGLEAAFDVEPDLIITDVLMPRMDGWEFVRRLRSYPQFALVPMFFLTTKGGAHDRIAGYQLGADDYLGKPVNFPELPRRVLKALAYRRQLEQQLDLPAAGGKGLQGSLDQIGMATLLSVLNAGRRSGILRLFGDGVWDDVLIYLVRGHMHRVEVQGRGRMSTDQALRQLMSRLRGSFEFSPMNLRMPDEMNLPIIRLLLQGVAPAHV
jgi:CheY-like chemotaxis protein